MVYSLSGLTQGFHYNVFRRRSVGCQMDKTFGIELHLQVIIFFNQISDFH